jgi:hypothetical protein
MDETVIRAMDKWPDVPAVFGWLSLSRRGEWLIRGERIPHRASCAFISRNYAGDDRGRWFFQNGPQRVYVALEYTPWVIGLDAGGGLVTHTGTSIRVPEAVWLDDAGNLLLMTELGIGVLDDRDLDAISTRLCHAGEGRNDELLEQAVAETRSGRAGNLNFVWEGRTLTVGSVARAEVAKRFGFDPAPE